MKMHVALAAALAALGSHSALAASESGDTRSEVQPQTGCTVDPAAPQ